jgi:hypothetical protein
MNRRLQKEFAATKHTYVFDTEKAEVHLAHITFIIPPTYPFKPPQCKYQGKNYSSYLIRRQIKLMDFICYNQIAVPCACCHNILCDWSPASTLDDAVRHFTGAHKRLARIQKYAAYLTKLDLDPFLVKHIGTFLNF